MAVGKLTAQDLLTGQQFVEEIQNIIFQDGPRGADLYFRQMAEEGRIDLSRLKALVLSENKGKSKKIEVLIHPDNKEVVPFMQKQLERERIDFVELVAIEDATLPSPKEPFVETKASYDRWTKYRMGFVSITTLIGLMAGAIVPDQFAHGWSFENIDSYKVLTASIMSMFVISVEICTSIYTSSLDSFLWSPRDFQRLRLSSDSGKRIHARLTDFLKNLGLSLMALSQGQGAEARFNFAEAMNGAGRMAGDGMVKLGFNQITDLGNNLLTKARNRSPSGEIKYNANYWNINIFNFVYMNAVFLVGYSMSYFTGIPTDNLFVHMGISAASVFAFYFACAKNQNNIGTLKALGYIDEATRLKSELMGLYFAKPWRIMAELGGPSITILGFATGVPMLQMAGISLQLLSGLLVTVPSTRRLAEIERFARETGAIFDENHRLAQAGDLVERPFKYRGIESGAPKGVVQKCLYYLKGGYLKNGARLPQTAI
ncbi:MAG: hypothetical protein R3A80_11605 [Bdellovibrionota bacterium]